MLSSFALIIPCYNEAKRFNEEAYKGFMAANPTPHLIFVNDGSKDATLEVLTGLSKTYSDRVQVLNLEHNQGKATAVREGIQHALKQESFSTLAYIDADLAVSLEECVALSKELKGNVGFVFASRILKIDNTIERKFYRFFIGRIIATIISNLLGVKVYDTQCGCKLFTTEFAQIAFRSPFISRWLFDVEIFFRLIQKYGRPALKKITREIPLNRWVDSEDSRVPFSYGFKIWRDLYRIKKHYNKKK